VSRGAHERRQSSCRKNDLRAAASGRGSRSASMTKPAPGPVIRDHQSGTRRPGRAGRAARRRVSRPGFSDVAALRYDGGHSQGPHHRRTIRACSRMTIPGSQTAGSCILKCMDICIVQVCCIWVINSPLGTQDQVCGQRFLAGSTYSRPVCPCHGPGSRGEVQANLKIGCGAPTGFEPATRPSRAHPSSTSRHGESLPRDGAMGHSATAPATCRNRAIPVQQA
jgi:hypothetical protein